MSQKLPEKKGETEMERIRRVLGPTFAGTQSAPVGWSPPVDDVARRSGSPGGTAP